MRIDVRIYRRLKEDDREYATLSVTDSTQDEVVAFIKRIIDAQGLSHFSMDYITGIEVKTMQGNKTIKRTTYFSFRGLSPVETKLLLLKHMAE